MRFLKIDEVAAKWEISPRAVQILCKEGKIDGAQRFGRAWMIPENAIRPIDRAEKSSIQVGHAVWIEQNCVVNTDGVSCGNCERHCPTGAIQMVPKDASNPRSLKIPVIDTERCIGCGACENLCPSRPFSAIYVEGHEVHRTL